MDLFRGETQSDRKLGTLKLEQEIIKDTLFSLRKRLKSLKGCLHYRSMFKLFMRALRFRLGNGQYTASSLTISKDALYIGCLNLLTRAELHPTVYEDYIYYYRIFKFLH